MLDNTDLILARSVGAEKPHFPNGNVLEPHSQQQAAWSLAHPFSYQSAPSTSTYMTRMSDSNDPRIQHDPSLSAVQSYNLNKFEDRSRNVFSTLKRNGLTMRIRSQTWAADSHELFDYETRNVFTTDFKCACMHDSYHITRSGTEVNFLSAPDANNLYASDPNAQPLACVSLASDGHYYLLPPSSEHTSNAEQELWLVVRCLRNGSVILNKRDVIKLGRFKLQIKDIVVDSQQSCFDDYDDCETIAPPDCGDLTSARSNHIKVENSDQSDACSASADRKFTSNSERNRKPVLDPSKDEYTPRASVTSMLDKPSDPAHPLSVTCRVCLCGPTKADDYDPRSNPLVAPCECNGSMKWIHLKCLQTWISGRLNIRQDSSAFFWKPMSCELCNVTYPSHVRLYEEHEDGQSAVHRKLPLTFVELLHFILPQTPYMTLEPCGNVPNKGIYVMGFSGDRIIRLGRGHVSDVYLADISVSRLHSFLRYYHLPGAKRNSAIGICSSGFFNISDIPYQRCFILEDHHSKFGTLLQLKAPFRLDLNSPAISIQVGRTVITVCLRRRWKLRMPACILQRQHFTTSDVYVIFRQPQDTLEQQTTIEHDH